MKAQDDELDRARLVAQLTRSIKAVSEQSESAVVALVGPWGSGKSTLLKAVEDELRGSGWHLARHNPWSYSSYESAVAGFVSELRHAVPDTVLGPDRRLAPGEWAARLSPLGAAGGLVGVDATGAMTQVSSLIMGDRSPERLREVAADGLRGLEQPVLVVLDDLDRLEPGELLLTFKLVRLIGRLPNVYYLLAYDEETLADVLEHTQLIGSGSGRAQQYLEKMVQVRLDIPPLLPEQQVAMMNHGIDDLCASHSVELTPDGHERLQQAWSECLVDYLDQPRALKRLFTQVDALWPEVAGEVDFVDFVLMTFLRTFERGVYDLVVRHRSELLAGAVFSPYVRQEETNADRWQRWQRLISDIGDARHPSQVAVLLSELFLSLRGARENTSYSGEYQEDVRRRRGVGCDEFFDRYTQIGVPSSDIPERLVTAAVAEFRESIFGPALTELESWFHTDASKITRKLSRADEAESLPAPAILSLLGKHYLDAMDQKSGPVGLSPDFGMLLLALRCLDREEHDDVLSHLTSLASDGPSGLALAGDLVQKAMYSDQGPSDRAWLDMGRNLVSTAIEAHLTGESRRPIQESPRVVRFLYTFKHLRSEEDARGLVWQLLDASAWVLEDLLGLLVPVGTASNGRSEWESMGEFPVGDVDALLGLERVLEALPESEQDETGFGSTFERRRAGATLEDRRRYALVALGRLRQERREGVATESKD